MVIGTRNISKSRRFVRDIEGSADFQYVVPSMITGANVVIDFESAIDTSGRNNVKYTPFTNLVIYNPDSSNAILVDINQDSGKRFFINSNSSQIIIFNGGIFSLRITNNGTGTNSTARITISRSGTTSDKLSKAIANNIFAKVLLRT